MRTAPEDLCDAGALLGKKRALATSAEVSLSVGLGWRRDDEWPREGARGIRHATTGARRRSAPVEPWIDGMGQGAGMGVRRGMGGEGMEGLRVCVRPGM